MASITTTNNNNNVEPAEPEEILMASITTTNNSNNVEPAEPEEILMASITTTNNRNNVESAEPEEILMASITTTNNRNNVESAEPVVVIPMSPIVDGQSPIISSFPTPELPLMSSTQAINNLLNNTSIAPNSPITNCWNFKAKLKSTFEEPSQNLGCSNSPFTNCWNFKAELKSTPEEPSENLGSARLEQSRIGSQNSHSLSNRKDSEKPDEKEIYKRVTAQLKARNTKRMIVKLVLQLFVFLMIMGCLVSSLSVGGFKHKVFYGLKVWKWFLLTMVIFSGMLVTHWVVHIIVFLIEWKFLLKKNVLYFTHALKTNVQVFVWLSVVLGTWLLLFRPDIKRTPRTMKILNFVTWTIASLLIGSFLWLIKTTLMKMLASSFHLSRFSDRIHESVFHHLVIQTLSGSPMFTLARETSKDSARSTVPTETHKDKKAVDLNRLHQLKKEKAPSYTMKLLVDVFSTSGFATISSHFEEDRPAGGVELDDDKITREEEAIATSVRVFENVVGHKEEKNYIDKGDLSRFMIREEVNLVYPLLEANEKGQISLQAFSRWVVRVYNDGEALQHALNDNKTAIKQLNKLVTAILVVSVIILWLLVTEIASTKVLLFLSSQLVVAAFVFGNTCKNIFEAIIFVFVMHPFDIGDRCVIDGNMMVVEEMNILSTVFLKPDKEKVYFPNSALSTRAIGNFYRSPDQGDSCEFVIDYTTPLSTIGKLKERIKQYLEQNPHIWHADHSVAVKEIENINKIKMALYFNHTMNFQDFGEKTRRRSELVLEMKSIFDELGIRYNLLPQEIYLNNMAAIN